MTNNPKLAPEIEAAVKQMWDSGHRIAMQIATLPRAERELAIARASELLKDTAIEGGATQEQAEWLAKTQASVIEGAIEKIDRSGGSGGGVA